MSRYGLYNIFLGNDSEVSNGGTLRGGSPLGTAEAGPKLFLYSGWGYVGRYHQAVVLLWGYVGRYHQV
jgi:hypothetical protein